MNKNYINSIVIVCLSLLLVYSIVYPRHQNPVITDVEFNNLFDKFIEFRNKCVEKPATRTFGFSTFKDGGIYENIAFDCDAIIKAYKTNK